MRRKRAWRGFVFMTPHFFAGKHSAQIAKPSLCERACEHRSSGSVNASALGKGITPGLNTTLQPKTEFYHQTEMQIRHNWFTEPVCDFYPGFFLESSLHFCASIIIFLNRRFCAANYCDALKKQGKEHLLQQVNLRQTKKHCLVMF